ncbi:hypothetical protein ACFVKB_22200 [Rhodococcus sp. NPDC127530]|uniref:hypothetical protein n=1 Tax=unclassified Rhodococcus (in: high G+C Gram-positive bacteria) TaxID=192944 RepID=UPI00363A4587
MAERRSIPREPRRELTDTDIEVEVAGIKAALEMGGLDFTDDAEHVAREVLTGETSGEDAFNRAHAAIRARHGLG